MERNIVFEVHGPAGRHLALRVHRPGERSVDEVRSELAWMQAVGEAGVRTPEPVPGRDGDTVQPVGGGTPDATLAVLLTWLDGAPLAEVDRPELWERLGELMGVVHRCGRTWGAPDGFVRPAWDREALVGDAPRWGWAEHVTDWSPADRGLIAEVRSLIGERLVAFGRGADRFGLLHGDLMFGNVLVDPSGSTSLIDFDDSGAGWFVFELAVPLYGFEGHEAFDDRRRALVRGYRRHHRLPDAHVAELPTFLAARRLATLGWMAGKADSAYARELLAGRVRTTPESLAAYLRWGR